jgi:DNA-binding FrmR family transcriptional regulator
VAQVRAARSALAKVEQMILADHLAHCVEQAIVSGDPDEQRRMVAELIEVFSRSDR